MYACSCLLEAEHSADDLCVRKTPRVVADLSPDVAVLYLYTALADTDRVSFGD